MRGRTEIVRICFLPFFLEFGNCQKIYRQILNLSETEIVRTLIISNFEPKWIMTVSYSDNCQSPE